ncbi:RING-type E3 ubiquitin transferase [Purpureocillium takamizusanense]|uniref:RING-type E3 ubiquitin transferase n=1 Tax=Purpureocillium takamizusanense TaxID=2060973 RepID=A0A9Q8QIF0_9HYPO|nr:RING-type E3 ubiquitin transferase [Purpureocillium takamizusanense]UNI20383.1 RING-type E3 ubiquitin transferase [Purpureocillium takamizusanense]
MEHALTCNNLKCRKELGDRALVTTCSHIFCLDCVHVLGIAKQDGPRGTACPACNAHLSKPDDAVITNLNPSEDYKTSVLSGLSPHIVMECAGRALSFWAYQTTQEIYYQQYLYRTLTEKYSALNVRLEQTVSDANAEIERLRNRVNACEAESEIMRRKNEELAQAYKDKSRRLLQTQELYDRVKRKVEMGQIERAASEAVDSSLNVPPREHPHREHHGRAPEFDVAGPSNHGNNRVDMRHFGRGVPVAATSQVPVDRSGWPGTGPRLQSKSMPPTCLAVNRALY